MVRKKVKGNKHLPKAKKEQYDFYHPAWKTHFDGTTDTASALLSFAEKATEETAAKSDDDSPMSDPPEPVSERKAAQKGPSTLGQKNEGHSAPRKQLQSPATVVDQESRRPSALMTSLSENDRLERVTPPERQRPAYSQVAAPVSTVALPSGQQVNAQPRVLMSAARSEELLTAGMVQSSRPQQRVVLVPPYSQDQYTPALSPATLRYAEPNDYQRRLVLPEQYRAAALQEQQQHQQQRALMSAALQDRFNSALPANTLQYADHRSCPQQQQVVLAPVPSSAVAASSQPTFVTLPNNAIVNGPVATFPQGVASTSSVATFPQEVATTSSVNPQTVVLPQTMGVPGHPQAKAAGSVATFPQGVATSSSVNPQTVVLPQTMGVPGHPQAKTAGVSSLPMQLVPSNDPNAHVPQAPGMPMVRHVYQPVVYVVHHVNQ